MSERYDWTRPDTLLGRRFTCDLRIVAIGPGPNFLLTLHGDRFVISIEELREIIERGFITEVDDRRGP